MFRHLFQNYVLGDYSEDGDSCFLNGKVLRSDWHKLHQGKLQIDEGEIADR